MVSIMSDYPSAIFFDWDGTLVDTLPGLLKAHNHVRQHFAMPLWNEAEFYKQMTLSSRELYPKLYGAQVDEAIHVLREFLNEHLIEFLNPLQHAEAMLRQLQSFGIPLGVISNKRHEYILREVTHLGWGGYFSIQAGSGYADQDKPSGAPIRKALSEININPRQALVWFVGDTETDILAAKDSGCLPILILHGKQRRDLVEKHSPAYVFEDCQDLLRAFGP